MNENENQTVNLGNNLGGGLAYNPIPNIAPIESTMQGQAGVAIPENPTGAYTVTNTIVPPVTSQQVNIQAQAQVVQQTVTNPYTYNQGNVSVQQSQVPQAPVVEVVETASAPAMEVVVKDKFEVNASVFKSMVSNAKKAATCQAIVAQSNVFEITFCKDYLKIVASDGYNVFTQINRYMRFTKDLHFNIPAELFNNLLSKLDTENIVIDLNETNRYISVTTDDGSVFNIPEGYEQGTGKTILLEKPEYAQQEGDIVIDVNGVEFKQLVQSAHALSAKEANVQFLSGVYFTDKVYSTDSESMFGKSNMPQLAGYSFYLSGGYVNLLLTANLGTDTKLRLRKNTAGDVIFVSVTDGVTTIEGPCNLEEATRYPLDFLRTYMASSYTNKFTLEKSKLEYILEISKVFIVANTDRECCLFEPDVNAGLLKVTSINKQANQNIPITGLNVPMRPFYLRIPNILNILKCCPSEMITIEVDTENYSTIKIVDGDYVLVNSITNM